mmetsp:Transcript_1086/g.1323  ORF Transcript_1086/g.1323 Transcript_1086/m.1323 type:complete len:202 (-) Transcript_1086:454-1059(-)
MDTGLIDVRLRLTSGDIKGERNRVDGSRTTKDEKRVSKQDSGVLKHIYAPLSSFSSPHVISIRVCSIPSFYSHLLIEHCRRFVHIHVGTSTASSNNISTDSRKRESRSKTVGRSAITTKYRGVASYLHHRSPKVHYCLSSFTPKKYWIFKSVRHYHWSFVSSNNVNISRGCKKRGVDTQESLTTMASERLYIANITSQRVT